jgi:hypothetical protein
MIQVLFMAVSFHQLDKDVVHGRDDLFKAEDPSGIAQVLQYFPWIVIQVSTHLQVLVFIGVNGITRLEQWGFVGFFEQGLKAVGAVLHPDLAGGALQHFLTAVNQANPITQFFYTFHAVGGEQNGGSFGF